MGPTNLLEEAYQRALLLPMVIEKQGKHKINLPVYDSTLKSPAIGLSFVRKGLVWVLVE